MIGNEYIKYNRTTKLYAGVVSGGCCVIDSERGDLF